MQYKKLGRTGARVSVIALGTWLNEDQIAKGQVPLVHKAFEKGVNLFDTADAYGENAQVERTLGKLLKDLPRDEYMLATKCRWGYGGKGEYRRGTSRKHLSHAIDGSLQRLGLEFIDLYQVHSPDNDTPLEELVSMMGDLVAQGKILYWGLSNYNSAQTLWVLKVCDQLGVPYPVSQQPEYSILEPGLVEPRGRLYMGLDQVCVEFGMGIIPYSPLGGGMLTGKYRQGIPAGSRLDRHADLFKEKLMRPAKMAAVEALVVIAQQAGLSLPQMSLAWLIQRPALSAAIIGATRPEQLDENLPAGDLTLAPDVIAAIDKVRDDFKTAIHFMP